jgi:hypothetical protein
MIARCAGCRAQIRDCTAFRPSGHGHRTVIGWYHTRDGHERCGPGGGMARPEPLIDVACQFHWDISRDDCLICVIAHQVMISFHQEDRCIPELCPHPHVQEGY